MLYNMAIICLLCFLIRQSLQDSNSNSTCMNVEVTDVELDLRYNALLQRFPLKKTALDFIVIMDRSQSTSSGIDFPKQKDTMIKLFNFLIKNRRIYIHPSYARVALLSFGKGTVTEFDGISDSQRTIDACGLIQRLNITKQEGTQAQSDIFKAINVSRTYFNKNAHPDRKKIIWIFYDGEIMDGANGECKVCDEMKRDGVAIFTAGIGEWLDSFDKKNRLLQMASDTEHFACAETWDTLFTRYQTPVQGTDEAVYSARDDDNCDRSCEGDDVKCACNVITTTISCQACKDIDGCGKDGYKLEDNMIYTNFWFVIGVSIGGLIFVALIILVIALLCRRKRSNKTAEPEVTPDVPLPPRPIPPLVPRKYKKDLTIMPGPTEDPVYGNEENTGETTEIDGGFGGVEDISLDYDYAYEDNEKNMPQWGCFLQEEASAHKIKHLCVYSTKQKAPCGAWTTGFRLSPRDRKEINKIMSYGSDYPGSSIKIAGTAYTINKKTLSDLNLEAFRRKKKLDGSWVTEELQITGTGEYFIAGVADTLNKDKCLSTVYEIRRHLTDHTVGTQYQRQDVYENCNEL